MARSVVRLAVVGLLATAAISFSASLDAQASDGWLVGESGATGDSDLKLDLSAAKRALDNGASPADSQKRLTKAMGAFVRAQPGKNRLFDSAQAPAGAVDVTAAFIASVQGRQTATTVAQVRPEPTAVQAPAPAPPTAVAAAAPAPAEAQRPTASPPPIVASLVSASAPETLAEVAASMPLVMLTYPAQLTPAAEERIRIAYSKSNWPTGCGGFMTSCEANLNALDHAMVRTAYLLPDVYEALDRAFPGAVVLQPATIDVDRQGQLVYKLANPELPAAARLDFMTYVAPNIMGSAPSVTAFTHGLHILPMFALTSVHGTKGAKLLSLSDDLNPQIGAGPTSVLVQLTRTVGTRFKGPAKEVSYPTTRWKISDAEWQHVEGAPEKAFMAGSVAKAMAPIIASLRRIDRQAAARDNLPGYRALYSRELDLAGPPGETLLPMIIKVETEFTRQIASDLFKVIRTGDLGRSVRKTMIAEREFNKKTTRSQWMSAFSAGLGAFATGMTSGVEAISGSQMLLDAMQQGLTYQQAQQQFASGMSDLAAEQRSVTVQHGNQAVKLSGNNVHQFRAEFRKILLSSGTARPAASPSAGEGDTR